MRDNFSLAFYFFKKLVVQNDFKSLADCLNLLKDLVEVLFSLLPFI